MPELFEMRITRYRDADSFQHVVALLSRLFPKRSQEELAAGLAVTPVQLTHSASPLAANALEQILIELGASVSTKSVDEVTTPENTLEVNEDFLNTLSHRRSTTSQKAVPDASPREPPAVRPPWERD